MKDDTHGVLLKDITLMLMGWKDLALINISLFIVS
jgi:hypothetical protein